MALTNFRQRIVNRIWKCIKKRETWAPKNGAFVVICQGYTELIEVKYHIFSYYSKNVKIVMLIQYLWFRLDVGSCPVIFPQKGEQFLKNWKMFAGNRRGGIFRANILEGWDSLFAPPSISRICAAAKYIPASAVTLQSSVPSVKLSVYFEKRGEMRYV